MVYLIDALHLGAPDVLCVALVECGPNELLLVDSGPESDFDAVVEGIKKIGFRPTDVQHLLASHIHLDHTGGAWRAVQGFGTRIYGDKMNSLWGEAGQIPEDQVIGVEDQTELQFGSQRFRVLYTPGHA